MSQQEKIDALRAQTIEELKTAPFVSYDERFPAEQVRIMTKGFLAFGWIGCKTS